MQWVLAETGMGQVQSPLKREMYKKGFELFLPSLVFLNLFSIPPSNLTWPLIDMCGIFACYNYQGNVEDFRQRALDLSEK